MEVQKKNFRDQAKEGDQARAALKSKGQLDTEMDDHHALVTEKRRALHKMPLKQIMLGSHLGLS